MRLDPGLSSFNLSLTTKDSSGTEDGPSQSGRGHVAVTHVFD